MHRRRAIAVLAALAIPAALAQPRTRQVRRIRRMSMLFFGTPENSRKRREAFVKAMQELGYAEGKNVRYEWRYGLGQPDLIARHAREIDNEVVDVIVAFSTPVALALREAGVKAPIVMIGVDDPVREGFADELSRPGRNFTGMSTNVVGQAPRYVDLLHETVARADQIGMLAVPSSSTYAVFRGRVQEQAARRGLQVTMLDASTPAEVERVLSMPHPRMDALIVTADTLFYNERRRIAELAVERKLPVIYPRFGYVEAGGLMSYAPNEEFFATRGASFAARILDGDAPSDMPIEGPTRYELAVSRKAAQAIGLAVPASLMRKADRVVG